MLSTKTDAEHEIAAESHAKPVSESEMNGAASTNTAEIKSFDWTYSILEVRLQGIIVT